MQRNAPQKTTCSYCGVGCGILVSQDARGRVSVAGDPDHPVNRGQLCSKGRNLHHVVEDQTDRLLYPQMRMARHLPRQRVSWDQALDRAAAVFKTLISKYGPDSVGFYVSGQCLTEEYYLINKLVKGFLGTNNIDTNSRLCMSAAVVGYKMALGDDAVPVCYEDIELAETFLVSGANPAWCHPILWRRVEAHKEANPDVKIIVIDPRQTQTCANADLHLQLRPGTDTVLHYALARELIELGYVDQTFVENHTDGYAAMKEMALARTTEEAAEICDVPAADIRLAAILIGESKGYIPMWAMGLNQSVVGVNKNVSLLNLSLITGQIGKPGAGPLSLTGQPNAMGGREVGGMANLLAAHKNLLDPADRQEVADFWGVEKINEKPGLTATQMFEALESGKMKAIWVICTNPLVSLPDANRVEAALQKAKFVVVQDISSRSDTAAYADLVLPAAGWLEKEGTMTNSERRIGYIPQVVEAPGEARSEVDILCDFAQRMGFHGFDFANASEVYDEHVRLTRGTRIDISGLSYDRLKAEGTVQWPVPEAGHPGTPRLFTDHQFYTPNGRAQLFAPPEANESEPVSPDRPLILTTGRIRDQWHTMTRTGKVNALYQHIDQPRLEIHPIDAAVRGIQEEDVVRVASERGEVTVHARLSTDIKPGVVFLPMHWGKILQRSFGRANNLTKTLVDPKSKQPDFKFSAVEVSKVSKPAEKIVVVGAGAAAFRFVQTYRELNTEDELHVFSKEEYPFYNRVLLPEYISEHLQWTDLEKIHQEQLDKLGLHLHTGLAIETIDREAKTVTDSRGAVHAYDKLMIATGARAFVPRGVPVGQPGIHTMRSRWDADQFKASIPAQAHVAIVGGGLLGLELAASLRTLSIEVTIVQLASRLMERQLDQTASELLREHVEDMGIRIYFNDSVQSVFPKPSDGEPVRARLQSGKSLEADAVVYAIGTKPITDLAVASGLTVKRGVVVNEYLQTNDPDVYAMGEIAEYENNLYGNTASAEQQADVAARYLTGDPHSIYRGSVYMNILKFDDLDLCSLGMVEPPAGNPDYEEVVFIDRAQRYYKKCIIYKDRMVGALLMGDKQEFAEFKTLIESQVELSERRLQLLRSGDAPEPVIGPLICSCNRVGEGNLRQVMETGVTEFRALCAATGAGMGCGSCKPEVKVLLEAHLEENPVEEPQMLDVL
ncbi:MAG: molybdopterin-dependent oxidoreductase [Bacteroidota bacterium]